MKEAVNKVREVTGKSFRRCAGEYLRQWYELDFRLVKAFAQRPVTCEAISSLFRHYQLARSFKDDGQGIRRYQHFADALNSSREEPSEMNAAALVNATVHKLQSDYARALLSAVSKAFWMMYRDPFVIYDSNVRGGLSVHGLPDGEADYVVYLTSWRLFFNRQTTQRSLEDALKWLRGSQAEADVCFEHGVTKADARQVCKEPWFAKRVVDLFLFYAGKMNKRTKTQVA